MAMCHWALAAVLLAVLLRSAVGELTPPYFNLAEGRKISATATCGVGVQDPELYCKLVGANTENYNHSNKLIQGQVPGSGMWASCLPTELT